MMRYRVRKWLVALLLLTLVVGGAGEAFAAFGTAGGEGVACAAGAACSPTSGECRNCCVNRGFSQPAIEADVAVACARIRNGWPVEPAIRLSGGRLPEVPTHPPRPSLVG